HPRRRSGPPPLPYTTLFRSRNAGGTVGAYFADIALYLLGYLAYLFPVMIGWGALQVYCWQRREEPIRWGVLGLRFGGFLVTVVSDRKSTRLNSSHVKSSYAV